MSNEFNIFSQLDEQFEKYPNNNSPWEIETIKFPDGKIGYCIWVLRTDRINGWCQITTWDPYERYSHSEVILGIERNELILIINRNFDTWENFFGPMFNTLSEAKRFIDEYSYHYDTTYLANVLLDKY